VIRAEEPARDEARRAGVVVIIMPRMVPNIMSVSIVGCR
jgi:hypothetical protein